MENVKESQRHASLNLGTGVEKVRRAGGVLLVSGSNSDTGRNLLSFLTIEPR